MQICDYVLSDPEPEQIPDFTTEDEASFSEPNSENWAKSTASRCAVHFTFAHPMQTCSLLH